jgi:hypothetical protein
MIEEHKTHKLNNNKNQIYIDNIIIYISATLMGIVIVLYILV